MSLESIAGFDLDTVDRLLTTTRAVRRRLDLERPVEREIIHECIRLSQQAPTGSNAQSWRWLVVTDAEKRQQLADIYAKGQPGLEAHRKTIPEEDEQTHKVYRVASWFIQHLAEVPVHVIPCVQGRPPKTFHPMLCATIYGSILPAVWSFQLALRSRGLGSVLTTLHLQFEEEVRALFGIPENVLQVALLPVAYTRGVDFKAAARPDAETLTHWNHW